MNERTGIVEEGARRRLAHPQHIYIAPHDRLAAETPAAAEPIVAPEPKLARTAMSHPLRFAGGSNGETVPDQEGTAAKAHDIIRIVCEVFHTKQVDVLSPTHARNFARPRQAAMFLMSRMLRLSEPSIGRVVGRDHSTVSYALRRKVPALLETDKGFASRFHHAQQKLRALWAVK